MKSGHLSFLSQRVPFHALFKMRFYFGPLFIDDAVPVAVARAAIRHDDVVAEDAFMFCSECLDGILRLEILMMCLEGHPARAHHFKRVSKLQVLSFDVDAAALIVGLHPRPADLECAM